MESTACPPDSRKMFGFSEPPLYTIKSTGFLFLWSCNLELLVAVMARGAGRVWALFSLTLLGLQEP
eukprot:609839-Amphidinium_carterae.1